MDMKPKNKGAVVTRKATDEGNGGGPADVVTRWLERQPLDTKLAVCLILAMTDGDRGAEALAKEILDQYETDLLAAAQDVQADIDGESRTMIGIWMGFQTVQGR